MYKLTIQAKVKDIKDNITDKEVVIEFNNKEELIEFLSNDMDGDNYGSSLVRIRKYDDDLYTFLGKMCNHIASSYQK